MSVNDGQVVVVIADVVGVVAVFVGLVGPVGLDLASAGYAVADPVAVGFQSLAVPALGFVTDLEPEVISAFVAMPRYIQFLVPLHLRPERSNTPVSSFYPPVG